MFSKITNLISHLGSINENPRVLKFKQQVFGPLGEFLIRLRVGPTFVSFVSLVAGIVSAFCIANNVFFPATVAFLISGFADGVDGLIARTLKLESDFGRFIDSVFDRYVDTAILLGIAWYYVNQSMPLYLFLTFATVVGTVVTSYSRARAESLALSSKYIGFLNRPERLILILVGLVFPSSLQVIVWILAVFSNITALHRILFYSTEARRLG